MYNIESLLSARAFLAPQAVGNRIFFISDMSGRLSLYAMDHGGSVPEPLLPPNIALPDTHLVGGASFYVLPAQDLVLVMVDSDGDEKYQLMRIPIDGGYPERVFPDEFAGDQMHLLHVDAETGTLYFNVSLSASPTIESYQYNTLTDDRVLLATDTHGMFLAGVNDSHTKAVLAQGFTVGDVVYWLWQKGSDDLTLLYGKPLDQRESGEVVPLNSLGRANFVANDSGLLFESAIFDDSFSSGYLALDTPFEASPVTVKGLMHTGAGEQVDIAHRKGNVFSLEFNIDGVSWGYEAAFDADAKTLTVERVLFGPADHAIGNGVLGALSYDKAGDRYALSYSTATSPTQIYTIEGDDRATVVMHTRERLLGLPHDVLSAGEDASYTTFDGLRVSARLYLPAASLGYSGPRPLVYYLHGGPQSQERPDFAWFSMPLIQYLTLSGFAVFVPNVRGSTGYGLSYTKHVDHDWGGADLRDHVHAMTEVLPNDPRLDVTRTAVTGRSYGGYMTLMLAGKHPELWAAACDMFGPFDLFTFLERIPETWKPYFHIALGHPENDHDFLLERSPKTHINALACPMLVVQGKNDPRVVEAESADLVEALRAQGKDIEYLMFENEGHGVLKYENRVTVYARITEFFAKHLNP